MVEVNADFRAACAVVVVGERDAGEVEAEFFAQFADKRRLMTFACFDFAAGELPVARPVLAGRAFGDEQLAGRGFR